MLQTYSRRLEKAEAREDTAKINRSTFNTSLIDFASQLGFILDDWQSRLLQSFSDSDRIILNCSRQSGKSTMTSIIALHFALSYPGSLVILISLSQRQSSELFRKCLNFYRQLDNPIPSEAETLLRLELKNGSRIISLPGKSEGTIRGYSAVNLLIIDEAARCSDELYYAVRPMLATSKGKLIMLSTPYGKRGFFFHTWTTGTGWQRFEVKANQCPRITQDFLDEELATLGQRWFNQEYFCSFESDEFALFNSDEIQAAMSDDIPDYGFFEGIEGVIVE